MTFQSIAFIIVIIFSSLSIYFNIKNLINIKKKERNE